MGERMYSNSIDEKIYNDCMEALKRLVKDKHNLLLSEEYQIGRKKKKLDNILHSDGITGSIKLIKKIISNRINLAKLAKLVTPFKRDIMEMQEANYFSEYRIAVYTCVFGRYDKIQEPYCNPNNIDYYIITDLDIPEGSTWKKVDLDPFKDELDGLSDVEKNRWFKMHPHLVFKEHKYSIYIDGNIVPVTDFTELVNRIGEVGIAMFWHSFNDCVYQEGFYNKYAVRKIRNEELENHLRYLREKGMPENYGMTTCNVIAREHSNIICCKLMDDWWSEFMTHCRRDQISFPFVAWNNGLKMDQIAKLGLDVWRTDVLFVVFHNE